MHVRCVTSDSGARTWWLRFGKSFRATPERPGFESYPDDDKGLTQTHSSCLSAPYAQRSNPSIQQFLTLGSRREIGPPGSADARTTALEEGFGSR